LFIVTWGQTPTGIHTSCDSGGKLVVVGSKEASHTLSHHFGFPSLSLKSSSQVF